MFDITGQDITLLSDEDLRVLIGRLCEAELQRGGSSPLAATWGGDQNSPDGGLDVHIATSTAPASGNALTHSNIGFQVKAEDMSRGKILAEMRPNGALRASIRELADLRGAYIIVSSKGSVSDSALRDRKSAMIEALADLPNANDLTVDFYDRNRIATWVRDHLGVVSWLRERLGKAISGWKPYADWTLSNEGTVGVYLVDDAPRIQGTGTNAQSVSTLKGIEQLRVVLRDARGVVRLVGLSGTGKTRLAQALFDSRIGEDSLPPDLAIYTNLSDDPSPQPVAVATDLASQQKRQVLVIDNCPPALHNRLSAICRQSVSMVSLLTIEYDVQEDQPEGTDVFELQPSSDDLIEKLLLRRIEGLSRVNAQSIAKFANGNSRVALALASAVKSGESVASLRDAELFERLFRQRHASSNSLLLSAQACSLAYSFQGEDTSTGEEAELSKLAAVIGADIRSFHTDIAELQRRDLLQQRGVWRALLPHAIANRLAGTALENILLEDLHQLFNTAPPRLLKSISRRLGYLHNSQHAQRIVQEWLSHDGWLGKVENLDELGKAVLANVAPVAPMHVIDSIDRAFLRQRDQGAQLMGEEFRTLLRSIAFDSEFFDRSVALILDLIEFEKPSRYANRVRNSFSSLFHLCMSGTHATVEQRTTVIDALLRSSSEPRRELGFAALDAMLKSSHFSSRHRFDFGGRPRDFGYFPRSREDVLHWFRSALALCAAYNSLGGDTSARIRKILADHIRGLWSEVEMFDEVAEVCRQFQERCFWPEGWTAIRSIRRSREKPLSEEENARLTVLEQTMRPSSLVERVRGQVLRNVRDAWDDLDWRDFEAEYAHREEAIIEIGGTLAMDNATLDALMPDLVNCSTSITLGPLAKGLVDMASDRCRLWNSLVAEFSASNPQTRSVELLACYLFNLQSVDVDLTETLLSECLIDPRLSEWFPFLQARVVVSSDGFVRLKQSIDGGHIPAERFQGLAYDGKGLDDRAIAELVPMISQLQDGFHVALEIIWMCLERAKREKKELSPDLLIAGRTLIESCEIDQRLDHYTHSIEEVIKVCLADPAGVSTVERLIKRLKATPSHFDLSFIEANRILNALFAVQPLTALNALFAPTPSEESGQFRILLDRDGLSGSPLDCVPEAVLLSWCDEDGAVRYPLIASIMVPFNKEHNSEVRHWKKVSRALLERAPDRIEILKCYIDHFYPTAWTGSRSTSWERNAQLLDTLADHEDASLAAFASSERRRLKLQIEGLRRQELEDEKSHNERFE